MSYRLPEMQGAYEARIGGRQTGCQHCGSPNGYDRTYGLCVVCGRPWRRGSSGRHWRTGEPPPPEFFARFMTPQDVANQRALSKLGASRFGYGALNPRLHPRSYALGDAAVWPSDLLAYRQQWEPFIKAHLDLWRYLNGIFESVPAAQQCPAGVFTAAAVSKLDTATQQFCASLALTRIRTSATDPGGILPQWNAWAGKSSAEILAGAPSMLKWHQDVVLKVGGSYKDDLVKIAKLWNLGPLDLPPVPSFSAQEAVIANIEGAGLVAQGLLQIIGYGTGQVLTGAADTASAVAKGLRDTAKALPGVFASPWTWIGMVGVVAVVGGALVVHYLPAPESRREYERAPR